MSTEGPFLYDEGPEPLHTGAPRRSGKYVVLIFGVTALLAVLSVVLLPILKGSAGDQSRQAVQVFLAAVSKHDTETAYDLLCDKERAVVKPADVAARYVVGEGSGQVVKETRTRTDGVPAVLVGVQWADGTVSRYTVVNSNGPHLCGVTHQG